MEKFDVIIIGAGPAGISACLYAKRAGLNVLVLHYGQSELEKANKIENYYGFTEGIAGKELCENGITQAKKIGTKIIEKEVIDIELNDEKYYTVKTVDKEYKSKALIIATRK